MLRLYFSGRADLPFSVDAGNGTAEGQYADVAIRNAWGTTHYDPIATELKWWMEFPAATVRPWNDGSGRKLAIIE